MNKIRDATIISTWNEREVARRTGYSIYTLRNNRANGTGIPFQKRRNGRVSYRIKDVEQWMKDNNKIMNDNNKQ